MRKQVLKVSIKGVAIATLIGWLIGCPALVQAASPETIASGREEFNSVCALCHGTDAKGTGPLSKLLINGAPDLTVLSKKRNGAFPFSAILDVIEGSTPAAGHGIREMPVWGRTFREEEARGKILDILIYLESIQTK